jgi:hypothetical protein
MRSKNVHLRKNILLLGCCISLVICSCKKLVEVDPPVTSTTGESVFEEDLTAIAVLTGMYSALSQPTAISAGLSSLSKRGGLSADELSLWSGAGANDKAYFSNSLAAPLQTSSNITSAGGEIWSYCYSNIFICNQAIELLTSSNTLTPFVKRQLLGEAKFMRAFLYFYIVNLYGDAPLVISSDYKENALLSRADKTQVYQLIVSDLKEAQSLLSSTYLNGQLKNYSSTPERLRPTTWAATALLARVYLYMGDYISSEAQASAVINNASLFNLSTLNNAFLKASSGNNEAIWQLQPVNTNGSNFWNTEDARLFVLSAAPTGVNSTHIVYLSSQLLSSFEIGDNRKSNWIGSYVDGTGTYYFPYKYKVGAAGASVTEYLMVLRLAELYLIRAEARLQQSNMDGAKNDLNILRSRAGATLNPISVSDKVSLLNAILHERQVELFAEWGHRWLDLKRTGNVDVIMSVVGPLKNNGIAWKSSQQWYPLPINDVLGDPNLVQNEGF